MSKHSLKDLKKAYDKTVIPVELDNLIKNTIEKQRSENALLEKNKQKKRVSMAGIAAAAAICLFVGSINVSPVIANTLADIPGLGSLVEICTFRDYQINEDTYQANLAVPQVKNGLNEGLEAQLNEKYLAEGKALYDQFVDDIDEMKAQGVEGHLGIDSGYEVKTDNDSVFAIARYMVNTVGSSSTTMTFDTVDKKNQLIVTLPSLFIEGSDYVAPISEDIKRQMTEQMQADADKTYWLDDELAADANFEQIDTSQNFYIDANGKLVICFDKYDIAPGYMGLVEFVIPTEVLQPILVNRGLIR